MTKNKYDEMNEMNLAFRSLAMRWGVSIITAEQKKKGEVIMSKKRSLVLLLVITAVLFGCAPFCQEFRQTLILSICGGLTAFCAFICYAIPKKMDIKADIED